MHESSWLQSSTPAFRLMIATSWLAPASWQDKQEEAIREAIGAGLDWMEFIRLVDRHRTPAISWAALGRIPGLEIPQPAKKELQKRSDASRMQAVKHCMHLAAVLKTFNRARIPVMAMKGPILSYELYGDLGLRQSHDLDLVVLPEDLAKAQDCLENMGWHLNCTYFPMTPRQWEEHWRMEYHLGFIYPHRDCHLELHWRDRWDTPGQNNARWARSIPSVWQGCSHLAMNPIDQVLYLCSHGAEHAWFRAKWLGDLARIHVEGRLDWQAALDQASRTGQERTLLACLRILQDVYGLPMPDLPGNPWKNLSPFLVDHPLYALKVPQNLEVLGALAMARESFRMIRYERLAVPQKTWRDLLAELAYRRVDFRVLHLPDRFFWAYIPLLPILSAWRRMLRYRTDI
jgi:hypothetical protein